jgi:hypothetical protein
MSSLPPGDSTPQGAKPIADLIEEMNRQLEELKPKKEDKIMHNDKGYAFKYKDGKVVSAARAVMEEKLGRKIEDHYNVGYKDGDKTNLDPDNLFLAYKAGVALHTLTCKNCGARGSIVVGPIE